MVLLGLTRKKTMVCLGITSDLKNWAETLIQQLFLILMTGKLSMRVILVNIHYSCRVIFDAKNGMFIHWIILYFFRCMFDAKNVMYCLSPEISLNCCRFMFDAKNGMFIPWNILYCCRFMFDDKNEMFIPWNIL